MAGITSLSLTFGGANYQVAPSVTVALPDLDSGNATATISLTDSGLFDTITITDGGAYYTSAPNATISFVDSDGGAGQIIVGTEINIDGTVTSIDQPFTSVPLSSATISIDSATGTKEDFRASVTSILDSANSVVSGFNIIDSGGGYTTAPEVTIDFSYTDLNYEIGENAIQQNATFNMVGEVQGWNDSDRELKLIRVGASDGKFHEWNTTNPVRGETSGSSGSVLSVREVQTMDPDAGGGSSGNVADFDVSALEFIDFSENNPFGDPI